MSIQPLLACCAGVLLASCAARGLETLVLDGRELHPSLATAPIHELQASPVVLEVSGNPQLSDDPDFVAGIARRAAQGGPLDGEGVDSALLALYLVEPERIGIYGLQAASDEDADRIEAVMRSVWAHNASLDVARIHRADKALVLVWAFGGSPACWEAVNAGIARRLTAP